MDFGKRGVAADNSLRVQEPRLRRYRRPIRDPLGRRMGCIFKDANCLELCHLLSGQASSGDGTKSAWPRRQPYHQSSLLPLRRSLFAMGSLEERKWKK